MGSRRNICTLATALAPAMAAAADWSVQSSAQVYMLAESNPQLLSGAKQDAHSGAADIAMDLKRSTELLDLHLNAGGTFHRYTEDLGLDRDDQQLTLGLLQRGERYSLRGSASVTRDTTLTSELATTGIVGDNRRHRAREVSVAPQWQLTERFATALTLGWQDSRYARGPQDGLSDYNYTSAGLSNAFDVSEATSATLLLSASRLDSALYSFNTISIDSRLQLQHTWSPRWQTTISGGSSRVRTGGHSSRGSLFSASLTHQAELLALDLSLSRSNVPNGSGLLTRRDEVRLNAGFPLSENLSASAAVSAIRSREFLPQFDLGIGDSTYARADLALSWRIARDWSLAIGAGGSTRETLHGGDSASNFDARMALTWRFYNPIG